MADQWHDNSISNALVRDDDDDIPDDWENEPEEKPKKSDIDEKPKAPTKAPATTKNKQTKKKYVGDERTSDDEFRESLKEPDRHYTAEELEEISKRAELRKEELKLNMASDFVGASGERHSLDNINLVSKEEFLDYSFRLFNRLELVSKSEYYPEFLDHLLNGLTKTTSLETTKRMSASLQAILIRKQNDDREKRVKAKAKKPVKPQLKAERKPEYDSFGGEGVNAVNTNEEYDEDNDFM